MSYIKIIDETKKCEVFLNENPDEEQIADLTEQGFIEGEWERAWDGFPYVKGYAPAEPDGMKQADVRAVRNGYLTETDKYMIADFPITEEEREQYKAYRQYLRDHTKTENWFNADPMTFETWKKNKV